MSGVKDGSVDAKCGQWYYTLQEALDACERERPHRSLPESRLGAFVVHGRDHAKMQSILNMKRKELQAPWKDHKQRYAQRETFRKFFTPMDRCGCCKTPIGTWTHICNACEDDMFHSQWCSYYNLPGDTSSPFGPRKYAAGAVAAAVDDAPPSPPSPPHVAAIQEEAELVQLGNENKTTLLLQEQIVAVVKKFHVEDEGCSFETIARELRPVSVDVIHEAILSLCNDGLIYCTIDDMHYMT